MAPWRLLVDEPASGSWNMAVDSTLLESRMLGLAPPTIRLYSFEPWAVTLGRFQKSSGVDLSECAARGFDIVRRPTGGRGVLHGDEVTYSVAAHVSDGVPRGVAASYEYICQGLVLALRLLGVEATLEPRKRGTGHTGACYLQSTRADLVTGGLKLAGSAQVWNGGTVLQHGSIVMSRDLEAESGVFRLSRAEAQELEVTTATLDGLLGRRVTKDELVDGVIAGFRKALGVDIEAGELSEWERIQVAGHLQKQAPATSFAGE